MSKNRGILNYKISLKYILLFLYLNFFIIILFGAAVNHGVAKGKFSDTFIIRSIVLISSLPSLTVNYLNCGIFENVQSCFKLGNAGLEFFTEKTGKGNFFADKPIGLTHFTKSSEDLEGYLLIPLYFLDEKKTKIQLVDINTKKIINTWDSDINKINSQSLIDRNLSNLERDSNQSRYQYFNPLLFDDGSIVVNSDSPLIKIDKCSKLVWQVDELFHHASNFDHNGNIWTPTTKIPGNFLKFNINYYDDEITNIEAKNGKKLYQKSVTEILVENNLINLITNSYEGNDPIHLNDIEPVLNESEFWKKGDVFLSLRNLSMIILFRPSENKLVWYKQGPWRHQHDIDIIDNETIAVYDNNTDLKPEFIKADPQSKHNDVLFYNFASKQITNPYGKLFYKHNIRSKTGSLFTVLSNKDIFVEETDYSRLLRGNTDGSVKWEFIWDAKINWARFLNEKKYNKIIETLYKTECP